MIIEEFYPTSDFSGAVAVVLSPEGRKTYIFNYDDQTQRIVSKNDVIVSKLDAQTLLRILEKVV